MDENKKIMREFERIMEAKLRGEFTENECCQILALVYMYGGDTETFTHLSSLATSDAADAAKKLGVEGSSQVAQSAACKIKKYVSDLSNEDSSLTSEWVIKWYNRWQVKPPKRYNTKNSTNKKKI